jgi:apolipoprotein N-acyltransferase
MPLHCPRRRCIRIGDLLRYPSAGDVVILAAAGVSRAVARQENIHLQLALITVLQTDQFPYGENRALLISPAGEVVWDYYKMVHPLDDAQTFAPGPGVVAVADTPLGRLSTVICYDMDFPALLRQVGQTQADVLLAPSSDWAPIKFTHAQIATFRAIENGVSLVRPTRQGLQIAVDHQGHVLASADSLNTPSSTMIAVVPSRNVWTLYPIIGDVFAYVSVVALLALAVLALRPRRTSGMTVVQPFPA